MHTRTYRRATRRSGRRSWAHVHGGWSRTRSTICVSLGVTIEGRGREIRCGVGSQTTISIASGHQDGFYLPASKILEPAFGRSCCGRGCNCLTGMRAETSKEWCQTSTGKGSGTFCHCHGRLGCARWCELRIFITKLLIEHSPPLPTE